MQIKKKTREKTSRVFAMHGVVKAVNENWLSHRNFLEKEKFEHHLQTRAALYVGLNSALEDGGDALTIDDATYAAYDAAVLASKYGHHVTLFVNPHNVITQSPYFFALLCIILDRAKIEAVTFRDHRFKINDYADKFALRQRVKGELLTLALEEDRHKLVQELAHALSIRDWSLPKFFQTLNEEDLLELSELGVQIGNHGWTHVSVDALSPAGALEEISKAGRWIEENFATDSGVFAVPFGTSKPTFPIGKEFCARWLLNDNTLPLGYVGDGIYNRETLKL